MFAPGTACSFGPIPWFPKCSNAQLPCTRSWARGCSSPCAYRADFVIQDTLLVELKSVSRFERVHDAQVLTYLRLLRLTEGLLINFNVPLLKQGVRRFLL